MEGPQGFLGQDDFDPSASTIDFLQWTEVNGSLNGQLQSLTVMVGGGTDSRNIPLTGLRNGSNVNLTLSINGTPYNVSGTLQANTLTLVIPDQRTGQFKQLILRSATAQDYNSAAQALRQQMVVRQVTQTASAGYMQATQVAVATGAVVATTTALNAIFVGRWSASGKGMPLGPNLYKNTEEITAFELRVDGTVAYLNTGKSGTYRILNTYGPVLQILFYDMGGDQISFLMEIKLTSPDVLVIKEWTFTRQK